MAVLPVLFLCVAGVLSAPYLPDFDKGDVTAGDLHCQEGASGLHPYGTATYLYEGETENTVVGSSDVTTGMKISARVHIQPSKDCMYTMQISESKLFTKSKTSQDFVEVDESKKFSRELEAQELLFSVKESNIHELFPSSSEKTHVLNLKRGILSTLQFGDPKRDVEQTDVNGVCKVKFTEHDGYVLKTKKMEECTDRIHSELGVQASTFQQANLPINPLNSTSTCKYTLAEDQGIKTVECNEVHILRPFSAGYQSRSGAITNVRQRLELLGIKGGALIRGNGQSMMEPTSLVFKYEHEEMKPDSSIVDSVDKVMDNLVDLKHKANLGAKQSYAHEFTRLVSLFRKLDRKRMMPVWNKYFDCTRSRICGPNDEDTREVYRQYLLDALTYCGTSTCVYVVHNVIIDEAVTGEKVNMFLQGVALVAKPSKAMIRDILEIADKRPSRQAYFTLGTLLLRFCGSNPDECVYGKTNPVTQAEAFLEGKLGQECEGQENTDRVEELIRTIKAIGNAGRPVHIWNTLAKCARMSLHQNVSIAALEAMRRLPCSRERLNELFFMLSNLEMDPERRIHVFLAIMRCPSKENLQRVVDQLNVEQSRQVGSFMWSYITNVNESSDLAQADVRKSLREILQTTSIRKFDLDRTKYSRAWEGSLHSKLLKSGMKAEGHLVFHPESYLPRSALLNVTAHVMGVPLNMLEMAVRVEGLETVIEDVFGPHGIMPDNGILKLFNITFTKDDIDRLRQSRGKRDVSASMEENIANLHSRVNKRRVQPSGSLSLKLFGQDVRLFSYDDIFWMIDQIDNMNVIELLLKLAKGGHKTFTKSIMFLEMTQTVPTGLGLPLKLKLTGSAVASVELDGKFDIRNMFWGPSQMELRGFVRPSAVAEVSGQMGIESHYIRSGMFVNASVFTSQVLKGGVLYKEGNIVKVNIDAPEEPVEIFNVSTTPFLYFNEDLTPIRGVARRISPEFCMNATMSLGLGLCTSFAVPVAFREYESPYFPLSGPAHLGVKLVKSDAKLTTYELKVKYDKQQVAGNGREYLGSFQLGTPGASYTRGVSGMVKYTETPKGRSLVLGSMEDKKKFEFLAQYQNDTGRFEVEARSNVFTTETVSAKFLLFNESIYHAKHIGAVVSASYGDFKVQQMWKAVLSTASYMLYSKTTYYPGKHLTGEVEFVPSRGVVVARFDANQFNQTADFVGAWVNTESTKGLDFTFFHYTSGKNGTAFIGYVADKESKRLVLNGSLTGQSAEIALGYKTFLDGYEMQVCGQVGDSKVELFTNYSTYTVEQTKEGVSEVLVGGRYNEKAAGGRFYLQRSADGKIGQACIAAFKNHDEPASVCATVESDPDETGDYKRISFAGRVLKKTLSVDFEFERDTGFYGFNSTLLFNEKSVARSSWSLEYNGLQDSQLTLLTAAMNRNVAIRLYSKATEGNGDRWVIGAEAKGFGKTMALTATYIKEKGVVADMHKVMFEAFYNEKLPISWTLEYFYPGYMTLQLRSTFMLNKYALQSSYIINRPAEKVASLVWDVNFNKEDKLLVGFKDSMTFVFAKNEKSLQQLWAITVLGKQFEYGWNLKYENLGNEKESRHQIQVGVQYARGKKLLLTTTLDNSASQMAATANFRFWHRSVTHTFVYQKEQRRLDIDVEFLPNVHSRVMVRLDRTEGWKLTSQIKFDWKNMNRVLKTVTAYVNNAHRKALTFSYKAYGQEFWVETSYSKTTRTVTLSAGAFDRTVILAGQYDVSKSAVVLEVSTVTGTIQTTLLKMVGSLDQHVASFEILRKTSLFRVAFSRDQSKKTARLEVQGLGKSLVSLDWTSKEKLSVLELSVVGQRRLRIEGKILRSQQAAFLYIDFLKKGYNVGLAGKYNTKQKSVTVTAEMLGSVFGMVMRADLQEHILGANIFVQDKMSGWRIHYDAANKAIVFNMTFTPQLSFQTVAEVIGDRVLKITAQRKIGNEVVNETAFSYQLSMYESRLVFEWNTETVKALLGIIAPVIQGTLEELQKSYARVSEVGKDLISTAKEMSNKGKDKSMELYREMAAKLLLLVQSVNDSYRDVDLTVHREKLVSQAKEASRQVVLFLKKAYKYLQEQGSVVRKNMPAYLEKGREVQKDLQKFFNLAMKIGQNLTDSAKPVVITAFNLAKEFKVRGKTMEELVGGAVKVVFVKTNYIVNRVKHETAQIIPVYIAVIKSTPLPYVQATLPELYNRAEGMVRRSTFDYDMKKTMSFIKGEVQAIQIKAEHYLDNIRMQAIQIPELLKTRMAKALQAGQQYEQVLGEVLKETKDFLKPVINLARNVNASIYKHYGPIVEKLSRKVEERGIEVYKYYKKQAMPYIARFDAIVTMVNTEIVPYITSMDEMTKALKGQMASLKFIEKKLMDMSRIYVEKIMDRLSFVPVALEKFNRTVVSYIDLARTRYNALSNATSEEVMDMGYELAALIAREVVSRIKRGYRIRGEVIEAAMSKVKQHYKEARRMYKNIEQSDVEEFLQDALLRTEELIETFSESAKDVITMVSRKYMGKLSLDSWTKEAMLNSISQYGMGGKLVSLALKVRDGSFTEMMLQSGIKMRDVALLVYSKAAQRVCRYSETMNGLMSYFRSVPRKSFEDFSAEVDEFVVTGSRKLVANVVQRYNMAYDQTVKLGEVIVAFYDNYYLVYVVPAVDTYHLLKTKSVYIYEENKDEANFVWNHYKTMANDVVEKNYEKAKQLVMREYNAYYKKLDALVQKYGDMTWEELGMQLYNEGIVRYEKIYFAALLKQEEAKKVMENIVAAAKKNFENKRYQVEKLVRDCEGKFRNIVMPKVKELYEKYRAMMEVQLNRVEVASREYYKKLVTGTAGIYNRNKGKTMEQIVDEVSALASERYAALALAVKSEMNAQYSRAVIVVKDILLPELKKEVESMFNQTIRASVILANTTVESFYPHYRIVVTKTGELIQSTREAVPVLMQRSQEYVAKVIEQLPKYKDNVQKLVKQYVEMYRPELERLYFKHAAPLALKYNDVLPHVQRKYEAITLLFHKYVSPEMIQSWKEAAKEYLTSLQLKAKYAQLQASAKELLSKVEVDVRQKVKSYYESMDTAELRQSLANVKESMAFTMEQIKPKLQILVNDLVEAASKVPPVIADRARFFRQYPEECVWRSYHDIVQISRDTSKTLFQGNFGDRYDEVKGAVIGFFFEVTDMRTKDALIELVDKVNSAYVRVQMLPEAMRKKYIDLRQKYYDILQAEGNSQLAMLQSKINEVKDSASSYWSSVKSEWSRCPITPIVQHEVWGEILDEVKNHELFVEAKGLAIELADLAKKSGKQLMQYGQTYVRESVEDATRRMTNKKDEYKQMAIQYKGKIQRLYELALEKYEDCRASCKRSMELLRSFYKEKTIEEIVMMLNTLMQKAKTELQAKKEVIQVAIDAWVTEAKLLAARRLDEGAAVALFYRDMALKLANSYKTRATREVEKYRPVIEEQYEKASRLLAAYHGKGKMIIDDVILKTSQEVKRLWREHKVGERFNDFKRMKIRDTVVMAHREVVLMPVRIQALYSQYRTLASKRANELKDKVIQISLPYLEMAAVVKEPLRWIGNEVNETLVFIYKYYGLKEKAFMVKDYVVSEAVTTAKMVPGIMKEEALKVKVAVLRAVYNALVEADKVDLEEVKALLKGYLEKLPLDEMDISLPLSDIKKRVKEVLRGVNWDYPSADQIKGMAKKYAEEAKAVAEKYAEHAKMVASRYTTEAKGVAQRYVDEAKVVAKRYVDNALNSPKVANAMKLMEKYRKYLNYITVEPSQGRIVIRIPHSAPVQPSFSYHVDQVSNAIMTTVDQTRESMTRFVQELEQKTITVREDLLKSYAVHRKLAMGGWDLARKYGIALYSSGRNALNSSLDKACSVYHEDLVPALNEIYTIARNVYLSVMEASDSREAMEKLQAYAEVLMKHARHVAKKTMKKLSKKGSEVLQLVEEEYQRVLEVSKPYQTLVKAAVEDVLKGERFVDAMENLKRQTVKVYASFVRAGRRKVKEFVHAHPEIMEMIEEYKMVHAVIVEKHLVKLRRVMKLAKVSMDRTVRILRKSAMEKSRRPMVSPMRKTAMIFGKSHVMTFDKKFYEFPEYNKKGCTYLLARDFHHGNYTILSQKERMIIITPDIQVSINPEVESWVTINGQTTHVKGLPVQSPSAKCILDGAFVKCSFKQGLDVKCDLQHFDCLIELSGWHYGKTEGLLGTNNNEIFDDFKMPGGAIADSVAEFADAWEISGESECLKGVMDIKKPRCNRLLSAKCSDVFGNGSPLEKYFSVVDPAPFQEACRIDTTDCDVADVALAHCNATASYVNLLRSQGYMARYLSECAVFSDGKRTANKGSQWTQSPAKAVDLVVLMSERKSTASVRKSIANLLYSFDKRMVRSGFRTKYALIGFGGDLIHERPHVHTARDGHVFMDSRTVASIIKEMPYSGEDSNSNDLADAIQLATTLSFHPEASRVFIVFDGHGQLPSVNGATVDEAEYALRFEANASLFVFDHYNFKNIAMSKVIGQSARRMYTAPIYRELPLASEQFPTGLFSSVAYETDGAIFSSKIKSKNLKAFVSALSDSVLATVRSTSQLCRSCYVHWGNAGQGLPICRTSNGMTC